MQRVITISVEGLPGSLLGPYGANTAITPAVNAAAAHGIVLDQCFLDSCTTPEMLTSLWTARHASEGNRSAAKTLWQLLVESGGRAVLITDCHQSADLAERLGCQQVVLVDFEVPLEPVSEPSQCCMMTLFTEAAITIEQFVSEDNTGPMLVWIHSRGFRLPWDAPIALRQRFADPEDPEPPGQVEPPRIAVNSETDPDLIVGWGQVAATQAAVLDQAIELLRDFLSQNGDFWAWCLIGLGGIPLGEHEWLGPGSIQLHGEELHVPTIVVPNPPLPVGARRSELCQLPDVGATIADLCGLKWPVDTWGLSQLEWRVDDRPLDWPTVYQTIGLIDDTRTWIRVPAWSLSFSDIGNHQLYAKPDDRWEISELSNRCSETVQEMQHVSKCFFQAVIDGSRKDLPALGDHLCNLMR